MTFRLVIANTADKPAAAQAALAHGDYLLLNEVRGRVLAWSAQRTRHWGGPVPRVRRWWHLENMHMWRFARMHVVERGTRVLLVGGHRGLGKSRRDRRRRGPSRSAPWQLVHEVSTRRLLILVDPHFLARTQTSERWRWPLMLLTLTRLRALLRWLRVRFPGVPIVIGGDGNLAQLGQWKLGKGWHNVPTPADFGRRHYTQLYAFGDVTLSKVRELHTASDHDAISCVVSIGEGAPKLGEL